MLNDLLHSSAVWGSAQFLISFAFGLFLGYNFGISSVNFWIAMTLYVSYGMVVVLYTKAEIKDAETYN